MNHDPISLGERLAAVLSRENAALAALDFAAATALLADKRDATDAFAASLAGGLPRERAAALGRRLETLVAENRRLLKHAIAVQSEVIGLISRAATRAAAAPRYRGDGVRAVPSRPPAMALLARV